MLLFHGSTDLVDCPEIRDTVAYLDFGAGFYTTTSYEQAERWARTKMRRSNSNEGYVSIYEFDYNAAKVNCAIRKFIRADKVWLQFVADNRKGIVSESNVDLCIGPVADDNVYRTVRLFETGVLDSDETIKRLKTEVLQDQWVLKTPHILKYLSFQKASKLSLEG